MNKSNKARIEFNANNCIWIANQLDVEVIPSEEINMEVEYSLEELVYLTLVNSLLDEGLSTLAAEAIKINCWNKAAEYTNNLKRHGSLLVA